MSNKVRNRRLDNPNQIKAMLTEQANILRNSPELDKLDVARALTYISNVALSSYREGQLLDKVKELETMLNERFD